MHGNACGNTESVFFFPQQDGHEAVEMKDIVDIRLDLSLVWCVFRLGKPMGQVH